MIYITQLIYIKEGQENIFHQFEDIAIPAISKYNGNLLLRIRPGAGDVIQKSIEVPYEIHLVTFEHDSDLKNFMMDKEREKFLHLKEQSVKSVLLIKGDRI